MKRLVFSPAATKDIDAIWDFTADRWNPDQADRYTDAIQETCEALAAGTRRGRPVPVRKGYLKCAVGSHMIYFRDRGERVEIMRVLHQRQDVDQGLAGEV